MCIVSVISNISSMLLQFFQKEKTTKINSDGKKNHTFLKIILRAAPERHHVDQNREFGPWPRDGTIQCSAIFFAFQFEIETDSTKISF